MVCSMTNEWKAFLTRNQENATVGQPQAKRQRSTNQQSSREVPNTIKFGEHKRALPPHLERLALTFCSLDNLGSLSQCSHQICTLVTETIATADALEVLIGDTFAARGLNLLAKSTPPKPRLKSLVFRNPLLESRGRRAQLLNRIITTQHGTLERLDAFGDFDILDRLAGCPNLRSMMLPVNRDHCGWLVNKLIASGCRLARLEIDCLAIPYETLCLLFSRARFEWLTLFNIYSEVFTMLGTLDLTALHTFHVYADRAFITSMELGRFLRRLPALTQLKTKIAENISNDNNNPFDLPEVLRMVQVQTELPFVAPKLREFAGPISAGQVISLTRNSPHLELLRDTTKKGDKQLQIGLPSSQWHRHWVQLDTQKAVNRNDLLTEALCCNVWPRLEVLELKTPLDLLALGEALLLNSWKHLTVLKLSLLYPIFANHAVRVIVTTLLLIEEVSLDDSQALKRESTYVMIEDQMSSRRPKSACDVIAMLRFLALNFGDDGLFDEISFPALEELHLTWGERAWFKLQIQQPLAKLRHLHLKGIYADRLAADFKRSHPDCEIHNTVERE